MLEINDKVFEGIGDLQGRVETAKAENVSEITLTLEEIGQIEQRIKEIAAAYAGSLMQRQDLEYLKDMEAAEAEAIERQRWSG